MTKIKGFWKIIANGEPEIDFYSFSVGLELLGAPYSDLQAMKLFQSLDLRANGLVEFQAFINWMYGLGRHVDRAKLLTTLECVCGAREWEEDLQLKENENGTGLPFYTFEANTYESKPSQTEDQNARIPFKLSSINWNSSNDEEITLIANDKNVNLTIGKKGKKKSYGRTRPPGPQKTASSSVKDEIMDTKDESDEDEKKGADDLEDAGHELLVPTEVEHGVRVPKNLKMFDKLFTERLQDKREMFDTLFRPCFPNEQNVVSIIVMGPGETGKSAMLNKFVKGVFQHEYDPTITDHFRKSFVVDEESAVLEITDTAGQEEFASMRYEWLRDGVDVLVITFTRASKLSFLQWKEQLKIAQRMLFDVVWDSHHMRYRIQPRDVPLIAVATKADLYEDELEVV